MPPEPPSHRSTDRQLTEPQLTDLFAALANERRRAVLRHLFARVGPSSSGELAEQLARREGDGSDERRRWLLAALVHCHLPTLADDELVAYDPDREEVALREGAEVARPFLDLAARLSGD